MKNNKQNEPLKTVLVITAGMLVFYFFKRYDWLLYVAIIISIAGLLSPFMARKIDQLWMKLAYILSFIAPTIFLTALFYVFLFPVSLLYRLFRKTDPLILTNNVNSTFKDTEKKFAPRHFENLW